MKGYLLTGYDLGNHRSAYREKPDESEPLRWEDVLIKLAEKRTLKLITKPKRFSFEHRFVIGFYWSPSFILPFYAAACNKFIYLLWGVPNHSNIFIRALRRIRLALIIFSADLVLVNDEISYAYCNERKIKVQRVPYLVDTGFFLPSNDIKDSYCLVPGNIDRDERIVLNLAVLGLRMVRVTANESIRLLYSSKEFKDQGLISCEFKVSFDRLRELYQHAKFTLLPVGDASHPAGQTCLLESIACGTPVIASSGYLSSIAEGFKSVSFVSNNSVREWYSHIVENWNNEFDSEDLEFVTKNNSFETILFLAEELILSDCQ